MKRTVVIACSASAALGAGAAWTTASEPAPVAVTSQAPALDGRLVDLTHAFDSRSVYWPTARRFRLKEVAEGRSAGGWYYAANDLTLAEHGGTHLDAPIHFSRGKQTADKIPLSRLLAPGILVDVSAKALRDPDYLVSRADLGAWERANGRIPEGAIVLLRTGYDRYWPDRERYMGTAERGPEAVAKLHFPGLDPRAARWLVNERSIGATGLDTPSIDRGQSEDFMSHRVLMRRNIPAFENLAGLDELPVKGFSVIALPMKIRGGSGGPLRAVAIVPR
jgi:kynurenine formamidase